MRVKTASNSVNTLESTEKLPNRVDAVESDAYRDKIYTSTHICLIYICQEAVRKEVK